jgi:hypothetical protein
MNKKRRKKIENVIEELASCASLLTDIKDEEDETRENIPDNLQANETFGNSEECSDILGDAITEIEGVIENLGALT